MTTTEDIDQIVALFHERARLESRVKELEAALAEAKASLGENITTWITLEPALSTPYPDDPRWTPWTRFGERAFRAAGRAHETVRRALTSAPSAPLTEEDTDG